MKLTTLMLIIALVQASAASYSQVKLSEKNISLEKVIAVIENQTGTNFFYNRKDVKEVKVSVSFNNVSLKEALDKCLSGTHLEYSIEDNTVFLSKKAPTLIDRFIEAFNSIQVKGRVTGEKGLPVVGAVVKVKDKYERALVTMTDSKGEFVLQQVDEKAIVVISCIGYLTRELNAKADLGDVGLQISNTKLDEIRVIGYGADTKRFSVGSVATVSAAEIAKQPVSNVLLALQGQVPGLLITPTTGAPGSAVKVQIRGQNTLPNSNTAGVGYDQPLFIVDGLPMAAQNNNINLLSAFGANSSLGNFGQSGGLSPFSSLNPADIESISVLKDAEATSIYGSQGANGVILITTKKGKPGNIGLDLSVNSGVTIATRQVKMLNTEQYLALRREAFANDGITTVQGTNPSAANYAPDLTIFDQTKNTDWFNYLAGKTSATTDAHATVSGGSLNSTFILSGGITHSGYNFPGDFAENRYTLHSGFQISSPNKKLTINLTSDFSYDQNRSSSAAGLGRNVLTPPNYPDLIDPSGNLVWTYKGYSLSPYQTFSGLKQPSNVQTYSLNDAVLLGYQVIPGLNVSTNLGYSRLNTSERQQKPLASLAPGSSGSSSLFATNTFQTIIVEPQLNYKKQFGRSDLSVLIGGSYKKNLSNNSLLSGTGYSNDALLGTITAASSVTFKDGADIYKYAAGFGRIGYIYDQRYIVSVSGRRDGSSNFGPSKQFGNFGSAGLGWIFSEEAGFKTMVPFISYGKLSGSYGTSGSDAVGSYQYQTFWRAVSLTPQFQGINPFQPSNPHNPDYSWDVKKTLNLSLDLGFIHDRILLNATWYRSRSGNQLINTALPSQTGFASVIENSPATVQNSGWEFTLSSTNIIVKDFKWTSNFNISGNRNKLLAYPGLATSPYASSYIIGKSITTKVGYKFKDVNPQTGLFEFEKANGDATYNPTFGLPSKGGDTQPIADLTPSFFGSLGNTFTYKSFSLSFLFQFSKQQGISWLGNLYGQASIPGGLMNLPVEALVRWQKPGDITPIQKLTASSSAQFSTGTFNFIGSSGAYSDASYIRLKNVSFSYNLPPVLLKKLGIRICQFYVNAQNLLLISGYKVGDPETQGGLFTFPLQRTIVCGLSFHF